MKSKVRHVTSAGPRWNADPSSTQDASHIELSITI